MFRRLFQSIYQRLLDAIKTMDPKLSVIIPTANRPQYLPRAVESALAGMKPGEVEVIVAPNGPDESWKESLKPFLGDRTVRIIPIPEANANIARNAGLEAARGKFVRFLDDDDYLIPEGARIQYDVITSSSADVVSGNVELVNELGKTFNIWNQPVTADFCAAVLGPWCNCHPTAHIFRRKAIADIQWNPNTVKSQDLEFLYNLCAAKEIRWQKINRVVGVWYHHWNQRTSLALPHNDARKIVVPMLLCAYDQIRQSGRLNPERQNAIASNLWTLVHTAFFLEPKFWTDIGHYARTLDSSARPMQPLYTLPFIRCLDPLVLQRIIFPKRWVSYKLRTILNKLRIKHLW